MVSTSHMEITPQLCTLVKREILSRSSSGMLSIEARNSRATSAARRERLRLFDLDDAQIARLHAPAGLPLGSRTPPEIALAIVADLTARRNGTSLTAAVARPATESAACPLARAA